uniref:Uncharacterized protein n=1 Tax=Compsopogon caeruleus TaxID=31354 RepID=A0A7S1XFM0_9RHOD|mmetsp:Transcript_8916/g.17955  ORF Transcript_8916/g.17955 Transcript_8916/m.17955 type:complete len:515 (+) Transcript_8916:365-1909(+)
MDSSELEDGRRKRKRRRTNLYVAMEWVRSLLLVTVEKNDGEEEEEDDDDEERMNNKVGEWGTGMERMKETVEALREWMSCGRVYVKQEAEVVPDGSVNDGDEFGETDATRDEVEDALGRAVNSGGRAVQLDADVARMMVCYPVMVHEIISEQVEKALLRRKPDRVRDMVRILQQADWSLAEDVSWIETSLSRWEETSWSIGMSVPDEFHALKQRLGEVMKLRERERGRTRRRRIAIRNQSHHGAKLAHFEDAAPAAFTSKFKNLDEPEKIKRSGAKGDFPRSRSPGVSANHGQNSKNETYTSGTLVDGSDRSSHTDSTKVRRGRESSRSKSPAPGSTRARSKSPGDGRRADVRSGHRGSHFGREYECSQSFPAVSTNMVKRQELPDKQDFGTRSAPRPRSPSRSSGSISPRGAPMVSSPPTPANATTLAHGGAASALVSANWDQGSTDSIPRSREIHHRLSIRGASSAVQARIRPAIPVASATLPAKQKSLAIGKVTQVTLILFVLTRLTRDWA